MAKENLEAGEIEAIMNELESKIGRLRALYEQYFLGIERMPPITLRKDVVRLIYRLENLYIRNTALKFKSRSLIQRFNSYKTYWTRVERQIEEGTYTRDIRRAERNRDRRGDRQERSQSDDGVIEIDFEEVVDLRELEVELEALDIGGAFNKPNEPTMPAAADESARRQRKLAEIAGALGIGGEAPKPAAATPQRQAPASVAARRDKLADIKARLEKRTGAATGTSGPSASSSGASNDARRVYDELIAAKRRCNEPTDKISYDSVAKSIEKQRSHIKETRGSEVDFKVVIKDGRAFIKPETK